MTALELSDRLLKRPHRGRAEAAIGEFLLVGFERRGGREQDGRAAIDRRVDKAVEMLRVAPGMSEPLESLTTPLICDVCANTAADTKRRQNTTRVMVFISPSPLKT